jgi:hypothetical protein
MADLLFASSESSVKELRWVTGVIKELITASCPKGDKSGSVIKNIF